MSSEAEQPDSDSPEDGLDVHGVKDATLGGYFRVHDRPPAFEGADGQPYTVSIETEKTADLARPWLGYLVFPRWAETGLGIVDHVQTPVLWKGRSRDEVLGKAGDTPLTRVKELLDEAIEAEMAEDARDGEEPCSEKR